YLEHAIQDARPDALGNRRVVSKQLQFAEVDEQGMAQSAGYAPYLDYRPLTTDEDLVVAPLRDVDWLKEGLEHHVLHYAVTDLVPPHLADVRQRKEQLVSKTSVAVKDRLTKEIIYWDNRALELRAQEDAG